MRLDAWFTTDTGRVRSTNQDSVGCFPEICLFMVADGMGGRAQGEVASRLAVETFEELLRNAPANHPRNEGRKNGFSGASLWRSLTGRRPNADSPTDDDGSVLRTAAEVANRRIFEAGQRGSESVQAPSMGTTVVALRCDLARGYAHWVHVGDSRLYRLRAGRLQLLTADHTVFGEAFREQEEIPTDLRHTNRLVQALGIEPGVEVATGQAQLQGGDLFLLCSDGISGMVDADTILKDLSDTVPLAERGQKLLQHALDAGGRDNATILLVQVLDS